MAKSKLGWTIINIDDEIESVVEENLVTEVHQACLNSSVGSRNAKSEIVNISLILSQVLFHTGRQMFGVNCGNNHFGSARRNKFFNHRRDLRSHFGGERRIVFGAELTVAGVRLHIIAPYPEKEERVLCRALL